MSTTRKKKKEQIGLVIVSCYFVATVMMVVVTTNAFASAFSPEYKAGYQRELSDWNLIVTNGTNGELHCPLSAHSAYCNGYNNAMANESSKQ